jgi:hypothetical protein
MMPGSHRAFINRVPKVDGRVEKEWQSNVETGTPNIKKNRLMKAH